MINMTTKEIYSEVYLILNLLGTEYINKLPSKLYKMIEEEKSDSYNKILTMHDLNSGNITREALSMIALFHLKYWCKSNDEKEKLKKLFSNNERKYQEEVREKYNPDNVFKNKVQPKIQYNQSIQQEMAMVEVRESIFSKIIKKIKNIFGIIYKK